MPKLFIIGNGFDLAHGMNTKYSDFRKYLIDKYNINENIIDNIGYDVPRPTIYPDGDEKYDNTSAVAAIIRILDTTEGVLWKDIETSLGVLDYSDFLDNWNNENNLDDDKEFFNEMYNNEDNAKDLCGALLLINNYFQDWIRTISPPLYYIVDYVNLISSKSDLFLNFNYTSTLETLYKAQNVCHIHGTQDKEIFFGHGNDEDRTDKFQGNWFGADTELNHFQYALRKDTHKAYLINSKFFQKIENASKQKNLQYILMDFPFLMLINFI